MKIMEINNQEYLEVIGREEILKRISELAWALVNNYSWSNLSVKIIRIEPGGFYIAADLSRALSKWGADYSLDGIVLSFDQNNKFFIAKYPETILMDQHLIIVQNLTRTGKTLQLIANTLGSYHPATIEFLSLGCKKAALHPSVSIKYFGFILDDEHYIGEGGGDTDQERGLEGFWRQKEF